MRPCAPSRNVRRPRQFSLIQQRGVAGSPRRRGCAGDLGAGQGEGLPPPIAPSRLQSRVWQSILCRSIALRSGNISRQWKAGQDDCRTEKRMSPGKSPWSRSVMHEFRRSIRKWRSNSTPCAPPDVIGSSRIVHRAQRQTAPGWPEVTKVRSGMHKGTERERIACRKTLASWFPLSFPFRQCLTHMESTRFWPFRTRIGWRRESSVFRYLTDPSA